MVPLDGCIPGCLQQSARPTTHTVLVSFLKCADANLHSDTQYMTYLSKIVESFPQWRTSRLPPPFVAQSEVGVNDSSPELAHPVAV